MTAVDDILAQIRMDQLASRLGVDQDTAERAARQALPALLGGIQANTDDPAGARSFAQAVDQHDGRLVEGGVDLDEVDAVDGDKIVQNVFGPQRPQVVNQLGGLGGAGGQSLMARLLPLLAPIVMSYLARQLGGRAGGGAGAGGGLVDILGQVLGGAAGGSRGRGGNVLSGGLGDLLGGLLGAGRR